MISLLWRGASQAVLVVKKKKKTAWCRRHRWWGQIQLLSGTNSKGRTGRQHSAFSGWLCNSKSGYFRDAALNSVSSVVSDSSRPHRLQHARPPCRSPTPGVYSNSCPSRRWCHPTISSSVVPFSSRLQSFSASGSFPTSRFFTSGGGSIGVSASASVLPMNI